MKSTLNSSLVMHSSYSGNLMFDLLTIRLMPRPFFPGVKERTFLMAASSSGMVR